MYRAFDPSIISIIMPILGAIIVLVIAVLLIIVLYKLKRAECVDVKSLEALWQELKDDNQSLRSELETIKSTLASIHKMMKDIE